MPRTFATITPRVTSNCKHEGKGIIRSERISIRNALPLSDFGWTLPKMDPFIPDLSTVLLTNNWILELLWFLHSRCKSSVPLQKWTRAAMDLIWPPSLLLSLSPSWQTSECITWVTNLSLHYQKLRNPGYECNRAYSLGGWRHCERRSITELILSSTRVAHALGW